MTKRIALCLDGTWNNPYQRRTRDDGSLVIKPSNPLKMARAILPASADSGAQVTYYDTGVGALGAYPGLSNRIVKFVDSKLGGAFGAGFEANIDQALTFLVDNYEPGDQVFVFGFSRGAAQARDLTRLIDWIGGIPTKGDAYFIPMFIQHYLETQGRGDPGTVKTASGAGTDDDLVPVNIDLLAVWDTVMALGSRFRASRGTSVVSKSFHVGATPALCVRRAIQALAIDEERYDFRPEIWSDTVDDQLLEQRWFAGVHSNVGGGYVKDGLANLPFRWFVKEAQALGLAFNKEYLSHFSGYHGARLYDSRKLLYTILETLRLRRGRGRRSLTSRRPRARLKIDRSVIHRMLAEPDGHEQLNGVPYRPANVIDFFRTVDDVEAYLVAIGIDQEKAKLPDDVMRELS